MNQTNIDQEKVVKGKATRSAEEETVLKAFRDVRTAENAGDQARTAIANEALEVAQAALVAKPSTTV